MKTLLYWLVAIFAVVVCFTAFPRLLATQQVTSNVQVEIARTRQKTLRKKNCGCCDQSVRDKFRQRARAAQDRRRKFAEQQIIKKWKMP